MGWQYLKEWKLNLFKVKQSIINRLKNDSIDRKSIKDIFSSLFLTKEDKKARASAWKETGIQICIELIQQLQEIEGVAGVHIMAIEWEQAVKPIVEGAGLYPRPVVPEPTPEPA